MANTHTHVFYGSTINAAGGDLRLANYTQSKTPSLGEAYLYLNSNVLTLRKNTGDVNLEAGGGGVTDPLRLTDNSAAAPTYSFASGTSTGIFRNLSGELALSGSGVEAFSISGSMIKNKLPQTLYSPGTTTQSVIEYHKSNTLSADVGEAYTTVATFTIPSNEACMIITEGVSRTGTGSTLEIIYTVRTVLNSAGTITENRHIDEVISDSWQYAGPPTTYTLQLKKDATLTKYFTLHIRILQINNSNITVAF